MKSRVRLDLFFDDEADARSLMDFARGLLGKVVSVNEGEADEEIAFCELELCGHDEGLPCQTLERVEVKTL